MMDVSSRRAKIASVAFQVPQRCLKNEYFNDLYQQDVATFLREKRTIVQRHFLKSDESTSDLIVPAAQKALERAGIKPEDLQLIIVATDTPDFISPPTSAVIQYRLGAVNAGIFDLNAACAGFVTAMDV